MEPARDKGGVAGFPAMPRRGTLAPERLPEFPPRSAAERAAAAGERGAPLAARTRRRLPLWLGLSVVIAAGGAGVVVGLDPLRALASKSEDRLTVVASAEPRVPVTAASAPVDPAPPIAQTGTLVTPSPAPVLPTPPQLSDAPAENAAISLSTPALSEPEPPAPVTVAAIVDAPVNEPLPAAPIPVAPPEVPAPQEPAPVAEEVAPVTEVGNVPMPALKPAELDGLVAKGERFLEGGDLASARLFFSRAAHAGDPRGARGLAKTYDPDVVRKLPVYGLPVNRSEADAWYARARELETGRAVAQRQ
jgi:hypothetical protein